MTGPEKLAEHSKWLEEHPWWSLGISLLLALLILDVAQLLRYGLQQVSR